MSVIPIFNTYALGIPMVSMLVYVWSRENPNAQINIYGLVQLRVCNFTTIDCNSHLRVAQLVNRQSKPCGPVDNMINSLVVDVLPFFLQAFYLPWVMLLLDMIFGSSLKPGLLGIMVGHLYYFFSVLHPLATGKNYLKTPKWVYPFTRSWPKHSLSVCIYN